MKIDGVALTLSLLYLAAKAAGRKMQNKNLIRLDDAVGAVQLYVGVATFRKMTFPELELPGSGG